MKNKRLTKIFSLITIIVLLCLFVFSGCKQEKTYYIIPEYSSNKTEQEHYAEISKRAEEILCEKDEHGDSILYNYVLEMVYNFKEEPQFFAIYFSYGEGVLGAIINDEYYVLKRESDVEKLWKDLGDNQIKKYYNGTQYNLQDGKLLNLSNNQTLTEEEYQKEKNKTPKIYVFDNEKLSRCKSLEEIKVFKRANQDFYQLYFLPDYATALTAEKHVENLLSRSQNKFNLLAQENNYINVKAELMPSFDNRLMYFMITYTAEDVIVNGEKPPHLYDIGIIINDEYYFLYTLNSNQNIIRFKGDLVETEQKYYHNNSRFNEDGYEYCGIYAIKENNDFYEFSTGVKLKVDLSRQNIRECYSAKVKNIYNPVVTDAFTVYQT